MTSAGVVSGPSADPDPDEPSVDPAVIGPDGLGVVVTGAPGAVVVWLVGELDMASAVRFRRVLAGARGGGPVVVDTRGLRFVDIAGERALDAATRRPDGTADPQVTLVVGPAVAHLRRALDRARRRTATRRDRQPEAAGAAGAPGAAGTPAAWAARTRSDTQQR